MAPRAPALLVDDDEAIHALAGALLRARGIDVRHAHDAASARRELARGFRGVVVLDLNLPDGDGRALLADARRLAPESPVVFLTGHGSTELAVDVLVAGAVEFLDKEHLVGRLADVVLRALDQVPSDAGPDEMAGILGRSRAMRAFFRTLRSVIDATLPVLVRGESGTGKELVARAIHDLGPRARGPFVAVNCAGIPESLLEAELFGYERGAFSGAAGRKPGRFDLARGGTLFLDEIGEMAPALQAKLLRVLQQGDYQRLGGVETLKADVRVVAATHVDLEAAIAQGEFRQDLYFRLAVLTLSVPPLRERQGDVPVLAAAFLRRAAEREGRRVAGFDARVLELLDRHDYPGNVRELENIVSYAVVAAAGPAVGLGDLPPAFIKAAASKKAALPAEPAAVASGVDTLADVERRQVLAALGEVGGNKAKAARLLGISRMTLYRKLKEMGIA
ncbi:MAG: sigma-54-dependent transcriptional regulator [Myxococcota bacterium]